MPNVSESGRSSGTADVGTAPNVLLEPWDAQPRWRGHRPKSQADGFGADSRPARPNLLRTFRSEERSTVASEGPVQTHGLASRVNGAWEYTPSGRVGGDGRVD